MLAHFFIASFLVANAMPTSDSFSQKVSSGRRLQSNGELPDWEIYSAERQTFHENGKVKEWRYGSIPGFEAALEDIKTFSPRGNQLSHQVIYPKPNASHNVSTWIYDETDTYLTRYLEGEGRTDISYSYDEQHRLLSWRGIKNGRPTEGSIAYNDQLHQTLYNNCVAQTRFLGFLFGDRGVDTLNEKNEVIRSECYLGGKLLSVSRMGFLSDGTPQKQEDLIYQDGKLAERSTDIYDEYGNLTSRENEYKDIPNDPDLHEAPLQILKYDHKYEVDSLGRLILHTELDNLGPGNISSFTTRYTYDDHGRLAEELITYDTKEEARTEYTY
jgi:hypothetical protein